MLIFHWFYHWRWEGSAGFELRLPPPWSSENLVNRSIWAYTHDVLLLGSLMGGLRDWFALMWVALMLVCIDDWFAFMLVCIDGGLHWCWFALMMVCNDDLFAFMLVCIDDWFAIFQKISKCILDYICGFYKFRKHYLTNHFSMILWTC